MLNWRGDAFEVLHRPQTNEKIQQLPQRNIQRTNTAAYRRGQRTFNSDQIFAERFYRIVWQPFIEFVFRCLASKDLKPRDFLFPGVRFFNRSIEHTDTRRPNIRPSPVPADEWNDRLIRHIQPVRSGNLFTCRRSNIFVRHKGQTVEAAALSRNAILPMDQLRKRSWTSAAQRRQAVRRPNNFSCLRVQRASLAATTYSVSRNN